MITDILFNLIQCLALIAVIVKTAKMLSARNRSMAAVFFLFALVAFLISDLYWVTYDVLRYNTRMPLAANEMGETAAFLLFASALNAVFADKKGFFRKETVLVILFVLANIALWIGWSGEWLQDIVGGAAWGYFIWAAFCALLESGVFSKKREWCMAALFAFAILILEGCTFLTEGAVKGAIDLACYLLMAALNLFFIAKTVLAFRKKKDARKLVAISFGGYAWSTASVYMSAGYWYLAFLFLETVYILFEYLAIRKAVVQE